MLRISEVFKLRYGQQQFQELLSLGKLPTELIQNEKFELHKKSLKKCKKHGD